MIDAASDHIICADAENETGRVPDKPSRPAEHTATDERDGKPMRDLDKRPHHR